MTGWDQQIMGDQTFLSPNPEDSACVCDGQTQRKGAVFQNLDDVFDVQMSSSSLQITQNNTNANKILRMSPDRRVLPDANPPFQKTEELKCTTLKHLQNVQM